MTGPDEGYGARFDAAQWSTLLAILTELRAIRALLERGQVQMVGPAAQVAARPPDVPREPLRDPRGFRDPRGPRDRSDTDPGPGVDEYWPRGLRSAPHGSPPGGAHRA